MALFSAKILAATLERSSDVELARLTAAGNREAFAVLARRVSGPVHGLLRRLGAQPALADDLTQDALMEGWRGIGGYRGDAQFVSWMMRIAARLYFKKIRKEARYELTAEPPDDTDGAIPDAAVHARLDLDQALARVSAAERICVSLCHGAGMTHDEIGEALNMPVGTVKSHVRRGVLKLKSLLEPEGTGHG